MDLKKIKTNILNKSLSDAIIIFKCNDNYIPNQYIQAIADLKHLAVNYIQNLDILSNPSVDIFDDNLSSNYLNVLSCEDFKCTDILVLSKRNYIVVTEKISDKATAELFSEVIVEVPKLNHWCIKDYVYSMLPACDNVDKEYLLSICNDNIYRVEQELSKLSLFKDKEQNRLLKTMIEQRAFGDLSEHTIFDFTNSIVRRDIKGLYNILCEFESIDIEPLGVVKLLTQNFEKVLSIQLDNNASAERLGMSPKQFYAISRNIDKYGDNNLLRIYQMLTEVDAKLKQGEISVDYIIDYLLINILI